MKPLCFFLVIKLCYSVVTVCLLGKPLTSTTSDPTQHSSPGLRKKLLPSQILGRPVGGSSIFYTKDSPPDDHSRAPIPALTRPTPFTPPLQRHIHTKHKSGRPPLTKPGSLDLTIGGAASSGSSSPQTPPTNMLAMTNTPLFLNKSDTSLDKSSGMERKLFHPNSDTGSGNVDFKILSESQKELELMGENNTRSQVVPGNESPLVNQKNNGNLIPVCVSREPEYV